MKNYLIIIFILEFSKYYSAKVYVNHPMYVTITRKLFKDLFRVAKIVLTSIIKLNSFMELGPIQYPDNNPIITNLIISKLKKQNCKFLKQ